MDYKKLERIIEKSIDPKSPLYIQATRKREGLDETTRQALIHNDLAADIQQGLEESDFFSQDYSWFLNLDDNGSVGFHPSIVAPRLIQIAIEKGSPKHAVSWLNKVIDSKYADGFCVMLLWGLEVDSCVKLANDVSLMSLKEIPESKKKVWATNHMTWFPTVPYSSNLGMPKSALVKKIKIQPFIYNSNNESLNKKNLSNYNLLNEIKQVLTLCGPSPVMQCVYWLNLEDSELDYAQYHDITSWHHYEVMPMKLDVFGKFYPDDAVKTVESYFSIKESKMKNRIANAINRLNLGMRRRNSGDAAVELSIALECLFADSFGENTYKIGLRVALLLGGTKENKVKIRSIVSGLYSVRSAMVHEGQTKDSVKVKNSGNWSTAKLVKEGCVICSCAISKIIELKKLPDWYEIELPDDPKTQLTS